MSRVRAVGHDWPHVGGTPVAYEKPLAYALVMEGMAAGKSRDLNTRHSKKQRGWGETKEVHGLEDLSIGSVKGRRKSIRSGRSSDRAMGSLTLDVVDLILSFRRGRERFPKLTR